MRKIETFDSTLRDGMQGEGVSFSLEDKLAAAEYLDRLGIDFIEGGNPASNPKDSAFFERLRQAPLRHAKVVAFASTRHADKRAEEDPALAAVLAAGTEYVSVFGKSWEMQATDVLFVSPAKNLEMIADTVRFLVSEGRKVIFDAEHFFDGWRADPAYAMATLTAAADAGASVLVLCDTNGGSFPELVTEAVQAVCTRFSLPVGIHTHNDCGMAVANAMAAVEAGASQVQGTVCGMGERCGNADLCTLIANLQLKCGYEVIGGRISRLTATARAVCELANLSIDGRAPYVGFSAFAHKGGMHADAVLKKSESYEHIPPETVGNKRRILMSEVAGRSALLHMIHTVAPELERSSETVSRILQRLKELENEGYQFDSAEGSLEMMIHRETGRFRPHFRLDHFQVIVNEPPQGNSSSALIKIEVAGESEITAAEGNGPVNALDNALRKALGRFYPQLKKMHLADYKVRVLDSGATASMVRVIITSTDGEKVWRTIGVSGDIIEASWKALVDSVEYYLG